MGRYLTNRQTTGKGLKRKQERLSLTNAAIEKRILRLPLPYRSVAPEADIQVWLVANQATNLFPRIGGNVHFAAVNSLRRPKSTFPVDGNMMGTER